MFGKLLAAALGPAIFAGLLILAPNYAGAGIMLWLTIYWACNVVPVAYTAVIPVIGFGILGVDLWTIASSFAHPAIMLILAPVFMILAATSCGLMERTALFFVRYVGDSVRWQAQFWLAFSMIVSYFAADVVVAIAMIPIVMKMFERAGYTTIKQVADSKSCMLIVIAVAIGASLGGILTPMAGGQAAITWTVLNKTLGGEVTVWSFTNRFFLPAMGTLVISMLVFACFPVDAKRFEFTSKVADSAWSVREKVVAVLCLLTIFLPYVRPWLPISLPWMYTILLGFLVCFRWPMNVKRVSGTGRSYRWTPLLPMKEFTSFPLHTFAIWPIAMSVSTLIGVSGTGTRLFELAGNFWTLEPYAAVGWWTLVCIISAQLASDTGSAGMLIPVLQSALTNGGFNPVPWIMMTGFTVDISVMTPTATGTVGVLMALGGRNHIRLPLYGLFVAIACGLFCWAFWGYVIANDLPFWQTLDVIK